MNKEKILVIIISSALVIFIVIIGFLFFNILSRNERAQIPAGQKTSTQQNQATSTVGNGTTQASTSQISDTPERAKAKEAIIKLIADNQAKYSGKFVDTLKSVDDCSKLKTKLETDNCIFLWASAHKDVKACDKISANRRDECLNHAH